MLNAFKFNYDYAKYFKLCPAISALILLAAIAAFAMKGLNYGVDFRGGAEIMVQFKEKVELESLRGTFKSAGVPISTVQSIGEEGKHEFMIKVQTADESLNKVTTDIDVLLKKTFGEEGVTILKTDIVGPKAGAQLRVSGFQAMAWALVAIMIYLALRFDYKYAPGAIAALFHDVLIILFAFVLTQKEFSLQIVAALLAVIGYSVNDTVVIYDRVRELEGLKPNEKLSSVINQAINETMSRTILTSTTTLVVCVIMFVMGGGVIHDFFFALSLGIITGTYSTIFIAAPITLWADRFFNQSGTKAAKAS